MKEKKELLDLEAILSKGGPRIRTPNCTQNGHKPTYLTYGFPPREIKKDTDSSKK